MSNTKIGINQINIDELNPTCIDFATELNESKEALVTALADHGITASASKNTLKEMAQKFSEISNIESSDIVGYMSGPVTSLSSSTISYTYVHNITSRGLVLFVYKKMIYLIKQGGQFNNFDEMLNNALDVMDGNEFITSQYTNFNVSGNGKYVLIHDTTSQLTKKFYKIHITDDFKLELTTIDLTSPTGYSIYPIPSSAISDDGDYIAFYCLQANSNTSQAIFIYHISTDNYFNTKRKPVEIYFNQCDFLQFLSGNRLISCMGTDGRYLTYYKYTLDEETGNAIGMETYKSQVLLNSTLSSNMTTIQPIVLDSDNIVMLVSMGMLSIKAALITSDDFAGIESFIQLDSPSTYQDFYTTSGRKILPVTAVKSWDSSNKIWTFYHTISPKDYWFNFDNNTSTQFTNNEMSMGILFSSSSQTRYVYTSETCNYIGGASIINYNGTFTLFYSNRSSDISSWATWGFTTTNNYIVYATTTKDLKRFGIAYTDKNGNTVKIVHPRIDRQQIDSGIYDITTLEE